MARQGVDADTDGDGGPAGGQLFKYLQVDGVGLTASPDALAERKGQQPRLAQDPEHLTRKAALLLELRCARGEFLVRDVDRQLQQLPGLAGEQFPLNLHRWVPSSRPRTAVADRLQALSMDRRDTDAGN